MSATAPGALSPESGISLSQSLESQSPSPHIISWRNDRAAAAKRARALCPLLCNGMQTNSLLRWNSPSCHNLVSFFSAAALCFFFLIVTQRSHQPPSAVIAVDGQAREPSPTAKTARESLALHRRLLACCTVIINSECALVVVRVRVICIHIRTESSPKPAAVSGRGR